MIKISWLQNFIWNMIRSFQTENAIYLRFFLKILERYYKMHNRLLHSMALLDGCYIHLFNACKFHNSKTKILEKENEFSLPAEDGWDIEIAKICPIFAEMKRIFFSLTQVVLSWVKSICLLLLLSLVLFWFIDFPGAHTI